MSIGCFSYPKSKFKSLILKSSDWLAIYIVHLFVIVGLKFGCRSLECTAFTKLISDCSVKNHNKNLVKLYHYHYFVTTYDLYCNIELFARLIDKAHVNFYYKQTHSCFIFLVLFAKTLLI